MDTVKGILAITTVLFAALCFILFIQVGSANNQLNNANTVSAYALKLLQAQDATNCGTNPSDYQKIASCMQPLLLSKDFKEDGFSQPDDKKGASGYLIIKNINHLSYNASRFAFYKDRIVTQEGCTITGSIDYNMVCRFNFDTHCDPGSVLEVTYLTSKNETAKVFTKNCKSY